MEELNLKIYSNNGMRTEKKVFSKKILVGSLDGYSVWIDVEIKEIDLSTEVIFNFKDGKKKLLKIGNTHQTNNLIHLNKYKTLSICGETKDCGGQILDILEDKNFRVQEGFNVKRFIEIWREYHLNDMNAGTQKQKEVLDSWKERPKGWSYDEDCEYLKQEDVYVDRGYKYGHGWLVKEFPIEIEEELKTIIGNIEK